LYKKKELYNINKKYNLIENIIEYLKDININFEISEYLSYIKDWWID
jgi:hypothetical protein